MPKREIGEIPTAPPALLLMLREFASGGKWEDVRKRIRATVPDLKEQSFGFESQNLSRSEPLNPTSFDVHLHGALDLLSGDVCVMPKCRVAAAERLARSFGLIADQVWLTDHLSTEVMGMGRPTNAAIDRLMQQTLALAPLLPLIEARIIRFRSPWIATCEGCKKKFEDRVEATSQEVLKVFRRDFKVKRRKDGGFFVITGKAFEPEVVLHSASTSSKRIPSNRECAVREVAGQVSQVLWTAREASMTGGSIFTNSRVGLSGLLHGEGRLPDRKTLLLFDGDRAFEVPWVSQLSPEQILQLRQEASLALPVFRERLARALAQTGPEVSIQSSRELISELRAQAAEVRAELSVKRTKSARYWKTTYGVLGLALSAYGVATDQIVPGVAGLLPILQLLISHKTGHEADVAKLTTRPGYVLVKAQDLLEHAH
jgi:hypothetical protein